MTTMTGKIGYTFSEMVRDTIATHGETWAYNYYVVEMKLPEWQWMVFSR